MSSMMHPVGPQPPSVYWVRRVVVLVVLVAIVAGIVWLVAGRGGGSTGTAAPDPSGSPAATPAPSVTTTPSPTPTRTSPKPTRTTESPKPTRTTTTPAAITACPDSAIDVVASTDAASYKIGATPRLRMQITNSSTSSCKRDVGASANELIVNKQGQRFWSSDDCNPGGKADIVTLEPGQSYSVSLGWLGRGSQPGCPPDQPAATAGTYDLVGRNGDVMSAPQKFALTD